MYFYNEGSEYCLDTDMILRIDINHSRQYNVEVKRLLVVQIPKLLTNGFGATCNI